MKIIILLTKPGCSVTLSDFPRSEENSLGPFYTPGTSIVLLAQTLPKLTPWWFLIYEQTSQFNQYLELRRQAFRKQDTCVAAIRIRVKEANDMMSHAQISVFVRRVIKQSAVKIERGRTIMYPESWTVMGCTCPVLLPGTWNVVMVHLTSARCQRANHAVAAVDFVNGSFHWVWDVETMVTKQVFRYQLATGTSLLLDFWNVPEQVASGDIEELEAIRFRTTYTASCNRRCQCCTCQSS